MIYLWKFQGQHKTEIYFKNTLLQYIIKGIACLIGISVIALLH